MTFDRYAEDTGEGTGQRETLEGQVLAMTSLARIQATRAPDGLTAACGWLDGREVLMLSYPHEPDLSFDGLTTAEREITSAVLAGRRNAEIARARGTSPRTIAKQVAAAMRKLGVRSRGELAAAASGGTGGHP